MMNHGNADLSEIRVERAKAYDEILVKRALREAIRKALQSGITDIMKYVKEEEEAFALKAK